MSLASYYGPWALVTGASDGIGQACAKRLAKEGFNLVLVARRIDKLEELTSSIKLQTKVECLLIRADLTNEEDRSSLYEKTLHLNIGLVIASAGFGAVGPFLDLSLQRQSDMILLNCQAVVELSYVFGQRFKLRSKSALILLSSILGFQGSPYSAVYGATKNFIQAFGEGLRVEWRECAIEVIVAAPGPVSTGFAKAAQMKESLMSDSPENVAREIIKKLNRSSTQHPGSINKLLSFALLMIPRFMRVRIIGQIMKKRILQDQTRDTDR